ncbi:ImmA/IrrE family metallo-endopeptidase [Pseudomonas amygdali pv. lachrymans]|nr:ImmA/IrrE family metallo-endopeptidase [Pseudomonas amygdali pv. lachrymans]
MHSHGYPEGREVEKDADSFASHLLMPREDVLSQIPASPSIRSLISAKKRWGVSVVALARTAKDVGLLTDWHYRELCKQMASAGYRSVEPEPLPRERSVLWKMVLEELWKDRHTKESIAAQLSLPLDEVDSLLQGILGGPTHSDQAPTRTPLRLV